MLTLESVAGKADDERQLGTRNGRYRLPLAPGYDPEIRTAARRRFACPHGEARQVGPP